ncbi:recombination protein RecR [Candidatus Uhrbacteria bacterium RIFOXYB12_FULL_58_10]|uniref:Recombination protein RecR n=1 Tax=Candidatus Uhrbacteria bacterium RIFOXYB2_FULL_57_15 TaxID=1802422 RepID=A0A1F7W814_9BACT|nr:MAG: recombination protein RecR [Candidatus Uhrbacteria bacterium RIFOXYB12_FULL_58_10]OGL98518.1 MAG: recombination protein RecR [Candidatus Uhrbacteria bacterium RIFOXYB2_FULL_57_15]OGL99253.1 MAG: recombination protein RecR [Candidatus Uhrbacteria bacterium RIFOXYC12_FULL_57_11]
MQNAVASFARLPGVGPKTALRFVYYLLKIPRHDLEVMARSIITLADRIRTCENCFTYCETPVCDICRDNRRDTSMVCVVEEPRDIATIESTGAYRGQYHVLGGVLNPIDGMTPDVLRVRELTERVRNDESMREVILALSPTMQGESTMMYLTKQLSSLGRRVTRLARGLPIGASLEYADEITLGDAMKGRRDA